MVISKKRQLQGQLPRSSRRKVVTCMEHLPPQFVNAMRTLFDLMDDQHYGYVLLREFERRWHETGTKNLPRDFIKFLYHTNHEKITFPLFCQALYNCLAKDKQINSSNTINVTSNSIEEKKLQDTLVAGPPKPPRLNHRPINSSDPILQNWLLLQKTNTSQDVGRDPGDGKSTLNFELQQQIAAKNVTKAGMKKNEPRRHTLQNGIDYNLIKRVKQLEEEKEILFQGLQMIEKVHCWYTRQTKTVADKMKQLSKLGTYPEKWTESQQERFELQKSRIFETNRYLTTLMETWDRGLPQHMNLAVRPTSNQLPAINNRTAIINTDTVIVAKLKQQNCVLVDEINRRNDRISMLEKEKVALIRELLQLRSQFHSPNRTINNSSNDEMIF